MSCLCREFPPKSSNLGFEAIVSIIQDVCAKMGEVF